MKNNTVRVHHNSGKAPRSTQAKTIRRSLAENPALPETQTMIPAEVARKAEDALGLLESVGNAAGALALLTAHQLKDNVESFGGWESFEAPGFGEGVLELARSVFRDFKSAVDIESLGQRSITAKLQDMNEPVTIDPRRINFTAANDCYHHTHPGLEDAIGALRNLIGLQGMILSNRSGQQIEHQVPMQFSEKLEASFNTFHAARNRLHSVFVSVPLLPALAPKRGVAA